MLEHLYKQYEEKVVLHTEKFSKMQLKKFFSGKNQKEIDFLLNIEKRFYSEKKELQNRFNLKHKFLFVKDSIFSQLKEIAATRLNIDKANVYVNDSGLWFIKDHPEEDLDSVIRELYLIFFEKLSNIITFIEPVFSFSIYFGEDILVDRFKFFLNGDVSHFRESCLENTKIFENERIFSEMKGSLEKMIEKRNLLSINNFHSTIFNNGSVLSITENIKAELNSLEQDNYSLFFEIKDENPIVIIPREECSQKIKHYGSFSKESMFTLIKNSSAYRIEVCDLFAKYL